MSPAIEKITMESDAQPTASNGPGIYMPRVQFAIRMILGVMSAVYFFTLHQSTLFLTKTGVATVIGAFLLFHVVWWCRYLLRGAGGFSIRLAAGVDLAAAFTGVLVDPFELPPAGMLVMIAVVGNGMQHGLKVFLEQFVTILVLVVPVFAIRHYFFFGAISYQLVFVNLFMGTAIFYVFLVLNRIELMKNEAERMAQQDPLTRLYNRNAFIQAAIHLLSLHERQKLPLVVMFADLDDFKAVNDRLGHAFGDEVLRYFARLTGELLRKSDIVARYGGDEFVFMLADMTVEEAEQAALRLQRGFLQWAETRDVNVGISFGIAAVPERAVDLDYLLKHVDKALYEAKAHKDARKIVIAPPLDESI